MNIREIREKSIKVLYKDLSTLRKDLVLLKINLKMGKSKDIKQKFILKKRIAQIKTVISEKGILSKNEEV